MTEITFYTFAENPLDVARRVAAKAHGQGRQVMIYELPPTWWFGMPPCERMSAIS